MVELSQARFVSVDTRCYKVGRRVQCSRGTRWSLPHLPQGHVRLQWLPSTWPPEKYGPESPKSENHWTWPLHRALVLLGVGLQPRLASSSLFHLGRIVWKNNPAVTPLTTHFRARGHSVCFLGPRGLVKTLQSQAWLPRQPQHLAIARGPRYAMFITTAATSNNVKPSPLRSIIAGSTAGAVEIGTFP